MLPFSHLDFETLPLLVILVIHTVLHSKVKIKLYIKTSSVQKHEIKSPKSHDTNLLSSYNQL